MPNHLEAVIFDCDGTLVDSEPISIRTLVDLVGEQGAEFDVDDAIHRWAGRDLKEVFAEIESRLGRPLPDGFLEAFRTAQMRRLENEVRPMPGAAELIRSITYKTCVASNAPLSKVRLCLGATGLLPLFKDDHLFSAYQVQAWKPLPDLFLHAASEIGVDPAHCLVVEDSPAGIEAGLNAGMTVVAYDPHSRLEPIDGMAVIHHLSELLPLLGTATK